MSNIILPGLIDPHVHLRDPGQTYKEDFLTGTTAALAGGYTTLLDMPNNKEPITTESRLDHKIEIAKQKIVCDVGFIFGSLGENLDEFEKVKEKVFALKLYLNETTGNFLIDKKTLAKIFNSWNSKPIMVHAEDETVEWVIELVKKTKKKVHFCHVSSKSDLELIIEGKNRNLPISCGVTPHHLFLTQKDEQTLGPFGKMKPSLKTQKDVDFLWENLDAIDCIESDHAPHSVEEKESGFPPYGVPGLETTLPLLLTAINEKRLTIDNIIRLCHDGPADIFGLKHFDYSNNRSKVEVNLNVEYMIKNENLKTKSKWSPFDGWKVKGRVQKVYIRGTKVFEDGKLLAKPGSGKII